MKNEKETRENLLKAAKAEFLEKGYMQASLRNICKNAGVTTGALYFFFEDKEDLFANLVQEPLNQLYEIMANHYSVEMELSPESLCKYDDFSDDIAAAREAVHYIYQYYDAFQLLLVKSQGSRFEGFVEQFVAVSERHYRVMADRMADHLGVKRIEDYMIHWIAHMQIDAFLYILTHEDSEETASLHMGAMIQYIIDGWLGMFRSEKQ